MEGEETTRNPTDTNPCQEDFTILYRHVSDYILTQAESFSLNGNSELHAG